MDRRLTEKQEWAIRLCHHDFGGQPLDAAAHLMGLLRHQVASLLKSASIKAPELFPILTHQQAMILEWWKSNETEPPDCVYEPGNSVKADIAFLKKQGLIRPKLGTVRYNSAIHDGYIKEKF